MMGSKKAGRIHVLTTPVTMFESWLARVLIFVVGYLLMFHAAFSSVLDDARGRFLFRFATSRYLYAMVV